MFPIKRTAWCGLAAVLVLGACGSGTDGAADETATPEVAVETDLAPTEAVDEAPPEEAAPVATVATDPPMTLPAPSGDGDASAQPADGTGDDTPPSSAVPSSSTSSVPGAAPTQPPVTAAPTTAAPSTTQAPTTAAPTTQAPAVNLFPDVSVVNVSDRQAVSMAARLGGGDRPVLLWFWTPF